MRFPTSYLLLSVSYAVLFNGFFVTSAQSSLDNVNARRSLNHKRAGLFHFDDRAADDALLVRADGDGSGDGSGEPRSILHIIIQR